MLRDNLVKVDVLDNELGAVSKAEAHSKPVLHRAFSVFLVNSKNEILIQKRAENKYHSAGLWANACCSHPAPNENIVVSAEKRLVEELGVECHLKELFSFVYLNKFNDNLFEYELDHVLIGNYDGEVRLDESEASEYMWISLQNLVDELTKEPKKFASWFLICAPKVIQILLNSDSVV